jgi:hypothetical protein
VKKKWKKGEQWDVFSTNSDDGSMQIQMVDFPAVAEPNNVVRDDMAAIRHVIAQAKKGDVQAIDALWEVLPYDGLVNRILWKAADPSVGSIDYPEGFYEQWGHLAEAE